LRINTTNNSQPQQTTLNHNQQEHQIDYQYNQQQCLIDDQYNQQRSTTTNNVALIINTTNNAQIQPNDQYNLQ
jgi:hypothetical protein